MNFDREQALGVLRIATDLTKEAAMAGVASAAGAGQSVGVTPQDKSTRKSMAAATPSAKPSSFGGFSSSMNPKKVQATSVSTALGRSVRRPHPNVRTSKLAAPKLSMPGQKKTVPGGMMSVASVDLRTAALMMVKTLAGKEKVANPFATPGAMATAKKPKVSVGAPRAPAVKKFSGKAAPDERNKLMGKPAQAAPRPTPRPVQAAPRPAPQPVAKPTPKPTARPAPAANPLAGRAGMQRPAPRTAGGTASRSSFGLANMGAAKQPSPRAQHQTGQSAQPQKSSWGLNSFRAGVHAMRGRRPNVPQRAAINAAAPKNMPATLDSDKIKMFRKGSERVGPIRKGSARDKLLSLAPKSRRAKWAGGRSVGVQSPTVDPIDAGLMVGSMGAAPLVAGAGRAALGAVGKKIGKVSGQLGKAAIKNARAAAGKKVGQLSRGARTKAFNYKQGRMDRGRAPHPFAKGSAGEAPALEQIGKQVLSGGVSPNTVLKAQGAARSLSSGQVGAAGSRGVSAAKSAVKDVGNKLGPGARAEVTKAMNSAPGRFETILGDALEGGIKGATTKPGFVRRMAGHTPFAPKATPTNMAMEGAWNAGKASAKKQGSQMFERLATHRPGSYAEGGVRAAAKKATKLTAIGAGTTAAGHGALYAADNYGKEIRQGVKKGKEMAGDAAGWVGDTTVDTVGTKGQKARKGLREMMAASDAKRNKRS